MAKMIRFYRDVLGFEIREAEDASNVYLVKDGTLFLLYGRKDFEKMTRRWYEYVKGLNGHSEIALYVDTIDEIDAAFKNAIENGASFRVSPSWHCNTGCDKRGDTDMVLSQCLETMTLL